MSPFLSCLKMFLKTGKLAACFNLKNRFWISRFLNKTSEYLTRGLLTE
jgi:hypothetical protein